MIKLYGIVFSQKRVIKKAAEAALRYFDIPSRSAEAEIGFLSDTEIRELNLRARGVDRVTDVLSFPSEEIHLPLNPEDYKSVNPDNGALMLGEIYISLNTARAQAVEYGHPLSRELAFLTVHGMLHLLGFDHIKKEDEEIMKTHAEKILDGAGFQRKKNG